ncbi:sensor histidine kinase [Maribellus maritimus]|uniref:sensor histidine kinase n=1 Tax=Maribellus maritimus TaxID=2870838 RepID=UPI001EEAFC96|nr:ATP-binding protein [Maribellus maritimus]MCG6188232.1 hypothetical protein [Maribellus maritimus]
MDEKEIATLVSVIILVVLVIIIITLFSVFVTRKNRLLKEQEKVKEAFEKELTDTQIEIREETLRNISWELHDNIGQLLTLAKIQLQNANDDSQAITEAINTIGTSLKELRSLSKLINPDTLRSLSLVEAIQLEIERYNRLKYLVATIQCSGTIFSIDNKVEIIIFRILQEFFTNTIKHSKASELNVEISYNDKTLTINAVDNGIGFDSTHFGPGKGIGLNNIKSRAKMINADLEILSAKDCGTQLSLTYKIEQI